MFLIIENTKQKDSFGALTHCAAIISFIDIPGEGKQALSVRKCSLM